MNIWDNTDEVNRIVQSAIDDSLTYQQTLTRLGVTYDGFNLCKLLGVVKQLNPDQSQKYTTRAVKELRVLEIERMAKELVIVQPMPNVDWEAIATHPLWQSYINRHFPPKDSKE